MKPAKQEGSPQQKEEESKSTSKEKGKFPELPEIEIIDVEGCLSTTSTGNYS